MRTSRPRLGALLCVALLGCAPLTACGHEGSRGGAPLGESAVAGTAAPVASVETATAGPSASAAPATAVAPSEPASPDAPARSGPPPVPREPTAARSQTPEGAQAFLGYYVAVLDRAFQFGDSTPLGAWEGPDCTLCRTHTKEIEALGAQKRRAGGTAYTAEVGAPRATGAGRLEVPMTLTRAAAPVVDAAGTQVGALRPSTTPHVVVLDWTGLGWQVTDLRRAG